MGKKITIKGIWQVLKDSFKSFGDYKIPKLSGSLAYCTVFSMAPLMVIIILVGSFFLGQEAAEGSVFNQLQGFLGADTAEQLQEIIRKASLVDKPGLAAVIGGIMLLVGATTVFAEIQDSINTIWDVKAKPKKGLLNLLRNRVLSFSVIISLGFLLLVSLAVSAVIDAIGARLKIYLPNVTVVVFLILNTIITLLIVSVIFAVIFKLLPDAKVRWKDIWAGALTTAIFFLLGKLGISLYISTTDIGTTYGAAGSLVILLVWVYYSSFILYFGAAFTRHFATRFGEGITPKKFAVSTKRIEVTGKEAITTADKE